MSIYRVPLEPDLHHSTGPWVHPRHASRDTTHEPTTSTKLDGHAAHAWHGHTTHNHCGIRPLHTNRCRLFILQASNYTLTRMPSARRALQIPAILLGHYSNMFEGPRAIHFRRTALHYIAIIFNINTPQDSCARDGVSRPDRHHPAPGGNQTPRQAGPQVTLRITSFTRHWQGFVQDVQTLLRNDSTSFELCDKLLRPHAAAFVHKRDLGQFSPRQGYRISPLLSTFSPCPCLKIPLPNQGR